MGRSGSLVEAHSGTASSQVLAPKRPKKLSTSYAQVALNYPPNWVIPLSEHAYEMANRAQAWLSDRGVIHDAAGLEKFRKLAVAEYANWPFADADPERAEVITKFLSLWIFYDDVIEEQDDGQQEMIRKVVGGEPGEFPGGDAFLRCWWELGQAYGKKMSPRWLQRHGRRFADWVKSVREESAAANLFRESGVYPPAIKHLERRGMNIGMIPNIDFLEYEMGWELDDELLGDPVMKRLEWLSAEVVAITNDIFGFAKDRQLHWCNLVSCLVDEFSISLDEAFHWVADMHNARVREIMLREQQLLARAKDRKALERWLNGLHHIMYGFARWHAMAPRYRAVHQLDERKKLRIAVREIR